MANLFLPFFTGVDGNGLSMAGAKIEFYTTGTSTPKATYSDSGLTTPNANPVVADANGLFGPIYLASGDYKAILKTSAGVTVATRDPVPGLGAGDTLTTRGDLLTRDATGYKRLPLGAAGQYLGVSGADVAWVSPPSRVGRRQTVLAGPVTSAGLPDFLPATATGLTLTAQNISSTTPFIVSASYGWDSAGPYERIGYRSSAPSWTSLTNTSTCYLYVDVAADGAITTGHTTTAPTYQEGGTYTVTSGANTFNIAEMTMKAGNGSAASQVWRVFVGEATTSGGNVTATVQYAYNARYESAFTATLPAASTAASRNHNIGVYPREIDMIIECTTTNLGYAVGDQLRYGSMHSDDGVANYVPSIYATNKVVSTIGSSNGPWKLLNKSTGGSAALTLASWKYKLVADRGWG